MEDVSTRCLFDQEQFSSGVSGTHREIKVSRADLLGDLKRSDKRRAYLDIGGQCWYVLGRDGRGRSIGEPQEIPEQCGVMVCVDDRLEVVRMAPKREALQLPFAIWMALEKAAPTHRLADLEEDSQAHFLTSIHVDPAL